MMMPDAMSLFAVLLVFASGRRHDANHDANRQSMHDATEVLQDPYDCGPDFDHEQGWCKHEDWAQNSEITFPNPQRPWNWVAAECLESSSPSCRTDTSRTECEALCLDSNDCRAYEHDENRNNGRCELQNDVITEVDPQGLTTHCCIHKTRQEQEEQEQEPYLLIGQGACRTSSGGTGTFTQPLEEPTTDALCQAECSKTPACLAYEVRQSNGRCEIHTEMISKFVGNPDYSCYVKEALS